MSAGASRSIIRQGGPGATKHGSFTPKTAEDIEAIVGVVPGKWRFGGTQGPLYQDDPLFYKGPPIDSFWLGQTVKGERGRIRSGFKHVRDQRFCITHSGNLALSSTVYSSKLDVLGHISSLGIETSPDEQFNTLFLSSIKQLVARGVFCLLNPTQDDYEVTSYETIVQNAQQRHKEVHEFFGLGELPES